MGNSGLIFKKHVILFGKSSIGKTTLLASICKALKDKGDFCNISDSEELDNIYKEMEKYPESLLKGNPLANSSTTDIRSYTIIFEIPNVKHTLKIYFHDIPGEHIGRDERIKDLFRQSSIVIVVVSTPGLMSNKTLLHEVSNQPGLLSEFIDNIEEASESKKIESKEFIFVPIKCEKYSDYNLSFIEKMLSLFNKNKKENELDSYRNLMGKINEYYSDSINKIVKKGHICSFLPVETFGSVVFDKFEYKVGDLDSFKEIYKLKNETDIGLKPLNTEKLGFYILFKIIEPYMQKFSISKELLKDKWEHLVEQSNYIKILGKPDKIVPKSFLPEEILGNPCCLEAKTKITLTNGAQKYICEIKPGDEVLTLDRFGIIEGQKVNKVVSVLPKFFDRICFNDNTEILATHYHLFKSTKTWLRTKNLFIGCKVISIDANNKTTIKEIVSIDRNVKKDTCYNIYVDKNCNFFANSILVSSFEVFRSLRSFFERIKYHFGRKINHE